MFQTKLSYHFANGDKMTYYSILMPKVVVAFLERQSTRRVNISGVIAQLHFGKTTSKTHTMILSVTQILIKTLNYVQSQSPSEHLLVLLPKQVYL